MPPMAWIKFPMLSICINGGNAQQTRGTSAIVRCRWLTIATSWSGSNSFLLKRQKEWAVWLPFEPWGRKTYIPKAILLMNRTSFLFREFRRQRGLLRIEVDFRTRDSWRKVHFQNRKLCRLQNDFKEILKIFLKTNYYLCLIMIKANKFGIF